MKFAARIDAWAVCLIATGVLVLIGVGIYFIYIAGGELVGVAGGIVMVLAGVLMSSFLMYGGYAITSSHVVLRWGPLPFRLIRIERIVEAAPVSSMSATLHVASSSHAIRITGSKRIVQEGSRGHGQHLALQLVRRAGNPTVLHAAATNDR